MKWRIFSMLALAVLPAAAQSRTARGMHLSLAQNRRAYPRPNLHLLTS